jgi:hypothetical protein
MFSKIFGGNSSKLPSNEYLSNSLQYFFNFKMLLSRLDTSFDSFNKASLNFRK